MKLTDALDKIRAEQHRKIADRATQKYAQTGKHKYYRRASDHYDRAEDIDLVRTAPHTTRREAKAYVQNRRDDINWNKYQDYEKNGVEKQYYED